MLTRYFRLPPFFFRFFFPPGAGVGATPTAKLSLALASSASRARGSITVRACRFWIWCFSYSAIMEAPMSTRIFSGDTRGAPLASRKVASRSMPLRCGDSAGVGDGVVPLSAAHLDDADLQITLACSHSINVPGTSDPTDDWYGAERNVDAWLGPLQQLLRSKKAGLPAWVANLLPA